MEECSYYRTSPNVTSHVGAQCLTISKPYYLAFIAGKCFENTGFCRCACSARCPIQKCRRGAEREDFSCCKGKIPPKIGAALVGLLNAFPTAYLWSSYFWWLGGQGDIYSRAYIIGTVTFVMLCLKPNSMRPVRRHPFSAGPP